MEEQSGRCRLGMASPCSLSKPLLLKASGKYDRNYRMVAASAAGTNTPSDVLLKPLNFSYP
jgi:hypothetical protein